MDSREGIFKERKVLRKDKNKHQKHARCENICFTMKAMKYVRESCRRLEVAFSREEIHGHFRGGGLDHGAGVKGVFK